MSLSDYKAGSTTSAYNTNGGTVLQNGIYGQNGIHTDQENDSMVSTTTYQGTINSMATLSNIGNSCYLNSVVYTLRFTPNFLHNLHHLVDDMSHLAQLHQNGVRRQKTASLGRNQNNFNNINSNTSSYNGLGMGLGMTSSSNSGSRSMSNKDLVAMANGVLMNGSHSSNSGHLMMNGSSVMDSGGGGALKCHRQTATEKLHELYQNLTRNENVHHLEPYQPVQLLNAIQDVSTTFEGNQQQDAHEFLMCVLDSIRETCQTLNRSYAETNEFQRTLNGVAHMACHDTPREPSNLSTAQIIATNNSHSNNSSSSSTSLSSTAIKSIFNLKRKSKRKEEKTVLAGSSSSSLPPTGLLKTIPDSTSSLSTTKVPDIVIDPTNNNNNSSKNPDSPGMDHDADNKSSADETLKQNGGGGASEKKIPKLDSDFFSDDFEGVTVSTTKCLSCETETEQKETMIDIAIPISGHESLESLDNPQAFFQSSCITKEYFRGDNKYRCEKCSAYTEAIRSISFEVLPRLLVVQLKRFSGGMEKINSFIPTPFVLQCFCRKCCALPEEKKLHVYRLYSVITHVGATMSAGHYITYTSSLDCYCDYLDCTKEAEKWSNKTGNGAVGKTTAVLVDNSTGSNGIDYELTDGKSQTTTITNLSNPNGGGHQYERTSTNLIDKIKKNRLFKNKSTAAASSGLRAKFSLGGSTVVTTSSLTTQPEVLTNCQNEILERSLIDTSSSLNNCNIRSNNNKQIGVGGYQPQVCRSMNCCTIKAKGSFLVKQVASCAEVKGAGGEVGSDWNLYCNNARHQVKFGGGGAVDDSTTGEGGKGQASMSSSSSSATSGSLKQNLHQNGGGSVVGNGLSGSRLRAAGANVSDEPIWYMCDDDKIKSMPQHEFKELLSSNRKIAITPYLLFYARSDL